jgi:peroxiredoxin
MTSLTTPICDFGAPAIDFNLKDTKGKLITLSDVRGEKGTLIAFICNHCPYVKAILPRLIEDIAQLKTLGVNTVAIMSNDPSYYPEDSPENMKKITEEMAFSFPYLLDENQQIAKVYGAICTPDFFGYNSDLKLQYRGRFDESRKETAPEGSSRDLFEAMIQIANTGKGPIEQIPSIGCSIKWADSE